MFCVIIGKVHTFGYILYSLADEFTKKTESRIVFTDETDRVEGGVDKVSGYSVG